MSPTNKRPAGRWRVPRRVGLRLCLAAPVPHLPARACPGQVAAPRPPVCAVHGHVRGGMGGDGCRFAVGEHDGSVAGSPWGHLEPGLPYSPFQPSPPPHQPAFPPRRSHLHPAPSSSGKRAPPTTLTLCTKAARRRCACGPTCWATLSGPASPCSKSMCSQRWTQWLAAGRDDGWQLMATAGCTA